VVWKDIFLKLFAGSKVARAFAWIFCAGLLAPGISSARESIPIKLNTSNSFNRPSPTVLKQIDIIDANECFAALQPIAAPFDIIKEGLDALVEQALAPERNLACVKIALDQWKQFATPEVELPKPPSAATNDPEINQTTQLKLSSELVCFNEATEAEARASYEKKFHEQCEGKWLSPEAGAALKEKLRKESAKNDVLMAQHMMEGSNIGYYVQGVWMQAVQSAFKLSNGKTFAESSPCFAPDGLSDAAKAETLANNPICGGKLIEGEAGMKLLKEFTDASQPLFVKGNQIGPYLRDLQLVNPNATIFTLARNAKCFISYPPGSPEAKAHRELNLDACGSFGFHGPEDLPAFHQKIRAQLDKLLPDLDRWAKKQDAKNEALGKEYDRLNPNRYADYGTRRLLAHFQYFVSQGGKPKQLREFCATYEKEQHRDRDYAKQELDFNPFASDRAWADAIRFGFTEAEYSAILSYTGAFYQEINKALWEAKGQKLSRRFAKYQEAMLAGMEKIPPYRGAVRRYSVLPADVLAAHDVGNIVTYDAYTSTSYDPKWEWAGGAKGPTHGFVIYSGAKGHRVDSISASEQENEVLFTPGVRFKILSRKEREGRPGVYDFVMAEVDDSGNVIADLPGAEGER